MISIKKNMWRYYRDKGKMINPVIKKNKNIQEYFRKNEGRKETVDKERKENEDEKMNSEMVEESWKAVFALMEYMEENGEEWKVEDNTNTISKYEEDNVSQKKKRKRKAEEEEEDIVDETPKKKVRGLIEFFEPSKKSNPKEISKVWLGRSCGGVDDSKSKFIAIAEQDSKVRLGGPCGGGVENKPKVNKTNIEEKLVGRVECARRV